VRYSTFKDLIATTTTYDDAVKIAEDYDVKNMLYDDGLDGISVAKDHTFYIMFNKNSATGVSNREHPELCIFYTDFSDSRINDYKTYYKAIKKTKLKDDWQLGILNTAHSSWGVTMKMKDYPDCEIYELPDEYKEVWKLVVERITDPRYSDYSRWMKCLE
jgi:hypothetical protein